MRLLLSILTIVMLSVSAAQAFTLVCKVTPVLDGNGADIYRPASRTVLESWMAPKQSFVIDLKKKTVIHKEYKAKTTFDFIDQKVIRWHFTGTKTEKGKTKDAGITYKYTYIRKSKKLNATIIFEGSLGYIRGTRPKCVEK